LGGFLADLYTAGGEYLNLGCHEAFPDVRLIVIGWLAIRAAPEPIRANREEKKSPVHAVRFKIRRVQPRLVKTGTSMPRVEGNRLLFGTKRNHIQRASNYQNGDLNSEARTSISKGVQDKTKHTTLILQLGEHYRTFIH
jgi:hypothetical protein